jgi:catechol 2,3-dioxygenase-like lactoylglutathione lyase family enzyme
MMTRIAPELPVTGVHHVKIPVADLARSRAWYERLLPLSVELEFRDADGAVRGISYHPIGGVRLALREDAARATALIGWDPIAFAVRTRADLDAAAESLDRSGIEHGPVQKATLGWLFVVTGPDDQQVRFYTHERHTSSAGTGS